MEWQLPWITYFGWKLVSIMIAMITAITGKIFQQSLWSYAWKPHFSNWRGAWNKTLSDSWSNVKFSLWFTNILKENWKENLAVHQKSHGALFQAPLQLLQSQHFTAITEEWFPDDCNDCWTFFPAITAFVLQSEKYIINYKLFRNTQNSLALKEMHLVSPTFSHHLTILNRK